MANKNSRGDDRHEHETDVTPPLFDLVDDGPGDNHGVADDEVLVLNMDEDERAAESFGVRGTYGAPPPEFDGEHDEFNELSDRWDARSGADDVEEAAPRFAPGRGAWIGLAAVGGALAVVLFLGRGEAPSPSGDDVATAERSDARNDRPTRVEADVASTDRSDVAALDDARTEQAEQFESDQEFETASSSETFVSEVGRLLGALTGRNDLFIGPEGVAGALEGDGRGSAQRPRERREGLLPIEDQVLLPGPLANIALADANQMSGVWTESVLPRAGIQSATFVQTPNVGAVRIHTTTTEFFDGDLVGLGEGRLVLRTRSGALTLAARQVREIEHLVDARATAAGSLVAKTSGERVRVKVAGGWIRGEIVHEHGETVTLMLDSGGRITVERRDIAPAASESAIRLDETLALR